VGPFFAGLLCDLKLLRSSSWTVEARAKTYGEIGKISLLGAAASRALGEAHGGIIPLGCEDSLFILDELKP